MDQSYCSIELSCSIKLNPILNRIYNMSSKRRIYICDSHKPKIHGGGCCSDKGSQNLLTLFVEGLQHTPLQQNVELIPTTCLSQCLTGISVRVWPDQVYYGKVTPGDIETIIQEHLIDGNPVARLRIEPQAKFAGW